MKKISLLSILLFFSLSLFCQTNWTKHPDNPVMLPGTSGEWDANNVSPGSVIFYNNIYHMWYNGGYYNAQIGYATSPDGINWTKNTNNPVLRKGITGDWDEKNVYQGYVLKTDSIFHMWYTGQGGDAWNAVFQIGHATSTDGITWIKDTIHNPVLKLGAIGEWDNNWIWGGAVLHDGNKYHTWYSGYGGGPAQVRIGHATSQDGINWTKDPQNPVVSFEPGNWDGSRVDGPVVIFDGTIFHMWYNGGEYGALQIGYATSEDGSLWKRYGFNPVLKKGSSGSWESKFINVGAVIDSSGVKYKMWYIGSNANATGKIGYAESLANSEHVLISPVLIPDSTDNNINHSIEITFQTDSLWASKITEIQVEKMKVHFTDYKISPDKIEILSNAFPLAGTYEILIKAEGYLPDAIIHQEVKEGGFWNNKITSFYPADNSFNIGLDTSLIINFENNVFLGEGNIKIFRVEYSIDDGLHEIISSTSENVMGNGTKQIIIKPEKGFPYGLVNGSYYIKIDDNVFGENFKGFNTTYEWSFTTSLIFDEIYPINFLHHNLKLAITLPDNFLNNDSTKYTGIFMLDGFWHRSFHSTIHNSYKNGRIPMDPVIVGISAAYDKDIDRDRVIDYVLNYETFYNYMQTELIPYITENFKIDPESRLLTGNSYAGFFTMYSFLKSSLQKDNLFKNFLPGAVVNAYQYKPLIDQLSAGTDSLGKNLAYFVGALDAVSIINNKDSITKWISDRDFTYFNFYSETVPYCNHTCSSYFPEGIEIILNMPNPFFSLPKYTFYNNERKNYTMLPRRWPENGLLTGIGVSNNTFTPYNVEAGTYTLEYSYVGSDNVTYSSQKIITVLELPVGIEEQNVKGLSIYPNPAKDKIYFETGDNYSGIVRITNIVGQLIYSKTLVENQSDILQIDLSEFLDGIYIITYTNAKNIVSQKIIKGS